MARAKSISSDSGTTHSAYRAWLQTESGPDWVQRSIDQVGSWLRGKDRELDVDLSHDGVHLIADKTLTVRRHHKGGQDAFRFTMVEGPEGRRYTTNVIFVSGRSNGWMSLQVGNDGNAWVGTPRLARNLLTSPGGFIDGSRSISPDLWHVRSPEDRRALLELLLSDRRGAVFVAAAGDQDPDLAAEFARKIDQWTSSAHGLAHVAYLDAASSAWLGDQLGGVFGVSEWSVRTFRPGIDPTSPSTLRMHRTLGMRTLIDTSEPRLRHLFSVFARQLLAEQPEPTELNSWRRIFDRLDSSEAAEGLRRAAERASVTRRRVEESRSQYTAQRAAETSNAEAESASAVREANRVDPATPAVVAHARVDRDVALADRDAAFKILRHVQDVLMLPDLSLGSLTALIEAATAANAEGEAAAGGADRIEALEDQVAGLEAQAEAHQKAEWAAREDAVDLQEQVSKLDDTVRLLSQQLAIASTGADTAADVEPPEDCPSVEAPGSWQDLVDRFESWKPFGVVITADPETAADLHDIDSDGRCLTNTWRGLTALAGYVRSKRIGIHEAGFKAYLQAQYSGFPQYHQAWFATSETSNAMEGKRGKERDLPVPASIHPDGRIEMQQHLRIGRIPNLDPRVYIHDDTSNSGLIVVGYIGPHLTTRATARLNR